MLMSERVTYRFTVPSAMVAALIGEAERRGTTPSRVLELLLRRYLAGFVAESIDRSVRIKSREGGSREGSAD